MLRLALTLPLWCYRAHLGWVLGERFLMLTHGGRYNSQPRQTILEVMRCDRKAGVYIISTGWSEQPEWFRHIKRNSLVQIAIGESQLAALAERVSTTEAEYELRDYAQRHPVAFRALLRLVTGRPPEDATAACRLLARTLPILVVQTGKEMS
jgi:deazaflavin-dependent oxidoreductase (nitroreductase family)